MENTIHTILNKRKSQSRNGKITKTRTQTFSETGVAAVGEGGGGVMKEMKKEMTKYDGKDKGKKDMKYEEGKGWIGKRKK